MAGVGVEDSGPGDDGGVPGPRFVPRRRHVFFRKRYHLTPRLFAASVRPASTRKRVFLCPAGRFRQRRASQFSHIPQAASELSPVNQPNVRTKSRGRPIRCRFGDPRGTKVCVLFAAERVCAPRSYRSVALRRRCLNVRCAGWRQTAKPAARSLSLRKRRFLIRDRSPLCPIGSA